MFDKDNKHKWFGFGGSLINLNYVSRVYTHKDKPSLTIEFHPHGQSIYEFNTLQERDEVLEKIWKYVK